MTNPPYEILKREDWVFELTVDGDNYRVIWMNNIRTFDSYEEHRLTVSKNGAEHEDRDDLNTRAVIEAAHAYRIRQLHLEYGLDDSMFIVRKDRRERLKEVILDLAERSWKDEFLGQYLFGFLYTETVVEILKARDGYELISELIAEKKLGLNGAILISYEEYAENFAAQERRTGHKKISFNDQGDWYCDFCKLEGDSQAGEKSTDYPCVEAV